MKKLLSWVSVIAFLLVASAVAEADWTFLGSSDGVFYYVDRQSVSHTGALLTGWIRLKHPVSDEHGRMRSEHLIEADCAGNRYRTLERVTYHRDGRVSRKTKSSYDSHYASSLSTFDKYVMRGICKK